MVGGSHRWSIRIGSRLETSHPPFGRDLANPDAIQGITPSFLRLTSKNSASMSTENTDNPMYRGNQYVSLALLLHCNSRCHTTSKVAATSTKSPRRDLDVLHASPSSEKSQMARSKNEIVTHRSYKTQYTLIQPPLVMVNSE